jgi:GrpB-like predicted nucleotidyltransferase (UPF0157 family)/ADP-ribose pyrophosphatase YjhB (NUDIX family)
MADEIKLGDDKPLGESLGWHRLSTSRPYESPWHNLRRDEIRLPGGQEIVYTYQEHPGFVTVVPVTGDGQVVMLRTYRYTVDDWCWELPAGGLGDKPDLSAEEVARAELLEETGGRCLEMRRIGWFYALNGTTNARCTVFLATGVELDGHPSLEATEHSEVHLVPISRALQMALDGRISDGDSALALLRCQVHLDFQMRSTQVVPYDARWPQMFEAEARRLAGVFGDELVAMHHMGSTAVPGLWAKPVIDILPEVRDIQHVDDLNDAMLQLGYVPKGENGIPGRRFFTRDVEDERRYHVHVFQTGDPEVARHLDFVEYLRRDPQARKAYAELKRALAAQYPTDVHRYTDAKTGFIREIDRQAAERHRAEPAASERGERA